MYPSSIIHQKTYLMRKRNYKILIADTSCLIVVLKIKAAYILHKLFEEVYITDDIHKELGFAKPQWLHQLNQRYQITRSA